MSDWKKIVGAVAPGLATALGGPLAGAAIGVIADKLLGDDANVQPPEVIESRLNDVLAGGLTPELRAKIIDAESALKVETLKINADVEKAYLSDVGDARKTHGTSDSVMHLAWGVLGAWVVLTGVTLYGLISILTGGIKIEDVGIVATVFTVMGSTVGYVSNSAQQVLSYYFGSSRGSATKTDILAASVSSVRR